ncbi:MAG: right-handed parallel beta-helix repeat-containing protein [Thermoplasmata archaeon]
MERLIIFNIYIAWLLLFTMMTTTNRLLITALSIQVSVVILVAGTGAFLNSFAEREKPQCHCGVESAGAGYAWDTGSRQSSNPVRINSDAEFNMRFPSRVIENLVIDGTGWGYGIFIGNCSSTFYLRNLTIFNVSSTSWKQYYENCGIHLLNCSNGYINNVTIVSPSSDGIFLDSCTACHLTNSTIRNTGGRGICLSRTFISNIRYNTIENSLLYGLQLDSSDINNISWNRIRGSANEGIKLVNSDQNSLVGNNITDSGRSGLLLFNYCYNNRIIGNYILRNADGVSFMDFQASNNLITGNLIKGNRGLGFYIKSTCTANLIYENAFVENNGASSTYNQSRPQAGDFSGGNYWNSSGYPRRGNYWYDWTSPDANGDGIVDSPYHLGDTNDSRPLASPPFTFNWEPTAYIDTVTPNPAITGQTVNFTGHGTDRDGTITAYEWSRNGTLLSSQANFSFTFNEPAVYIITFRVKDNNNTWSPAASLTLQIKAPAQNIPPVAVITSISPNPAAPGETVYFAGEGIDPDGTITGYEWSSSKDGLLSTNKDFSRNNLSNGSHIISFRVKDSNNTWSAPATINLRIELVSGNLKPVAYIDSVSPNQTSFCLPVRFEGHGTDADGTVVSAEWYSSKDGFLSDSFSFTIRSLSVGTHIISFRVKDNNDTFSSFVNTTVVIQPAVNQPPQAFIDSITPNPAVHGQEVMFTGHGNDSDGEIYFYQWASSIDGELRAVENFTTSSLQVGTHIISFRVRDNNGTWSDFAVATLVVEPPPSPNQRPAAYIISITPSPAYYDQTISFSGSGSDTDGTIEGYEWKSNITGVFSTEPNASLKLPKGAHLISFIVRDDKGAESEPALFYLDVLERPAPNLPPVVNITSPSNNSNATDSILFTGNASDPEGSLAYVEVKLTGITTIGYRRAEGTESWSFFVNLMPLDEGELTFTARAVDTSGLKSEEKSITVIHLKPPSQDGESPADLFRLTAVSLIVILVCFSLSGKRR